MQFSCRKNCEIILNFDQWYMRICPLKIFLILSSGGPFVGGAELFMQFM